MGLAEAIPICNDNQEAQKFAKNPVFHSRSNYIDIRRHFVREALQGGTITVVYFSSNKMMPLIFTIGLAGFKHQKVPDSVWYELFY